MSKQLQSISLGAAGFKGVNTMDPPLQQSLDFADTANNAVIDNYGRLGCRKGMKRIYPDPEPDWPDIGPFPTANMKYWVEADGTENVFYVWNDLLWGMNVSDPDNPVAFNLDYPAGYTPTGDDWTIVDFNGGCYFFQEGHAPFRTDDTLIATGDTDTLDNLSGDAVPAAPQGGICTAAYGRLWATGSDPSTVYWSSLLDGAGWTEGDSGSIDLTTVWPNGYDELVGIAAHNERIIFFGRNSIVIYTGATSPVTMTLEDAVAGTGCAFRESIQHTGEDVLFCSYTGVKSLGRTVLQSSMPAQDLTKNIRNQIQQDIRSNDGYVRAVYSPEESFYLITFQGAERTYCIDLKEQLDDGSRRVTVWPSSPFSCWDRGANGNLYTAAVSAMFPSMGLYTGYQDLGQPYQYTYFGPALDFGDASRVKVLKKMIGTMVGGLGREATFYWGYGYGGSFKSQVLTLADGVVAEYGIAEYNAGFEFSTGATVGDEAVNTTGSGEVVRVGISVSIDGSEFSLQQLRIHVIMGKIV